MINESQGRAVATVATTIIAGVPAVAFGAGPWGIALGLGVGVVTWGFGDIAYKGTRALILSEEMGAIRDAIGTLGPTDEELHPDQNTFSKLKRLAGIKPAMTASPKEATAQEGQVASNKVIALGPAASTVKRLAVEQIVAGTERNSFKVGIGRSLTKQGNPAVSINFYKQHFKFIGASQKGKSSMVASFLDAVTQTHDEDHVLIALLDLEDRTSRLFADLPHVAEVAAPQGPVLLHARNHDQVLEHLELLILVMTERYQMSPAEVLREPILLVYIEEFLSLKNYFKQKDKQKYTRLVFCINELARRGLKARVQLLLCAQVDYRDEDFQEALINVSCGMAFCVRQSATQAAGFYNTDLLRQNVMDNKVGQAVAEMPDCNDLILAPDYDLEQRLIELEGVESPQSEEQPRGTSILSASGGRKDQSQDRTSTTEMPSSPNQNPNVRKLTYLHRQALEHYRPNLGYRQLGEKIGVGKDKAGDLLKDLKKWNFLDDDSDDE